MYRDRSRSRTRGVHGVLPSRDCGPSFGRRNRGGATRRCTTPRHSRCRRSRERGRTHQLPEFTTMFTLHPSRGLTGTDATGDGMSFRRRRATFAVLTAEKTGTAYRGAPRESEHAGPSPPPKTAPCRSSATGSTTRRCWATSTAPRARRAGSGRRPFFCRLLPMRCSVRLVAQWPTATTAAPSCSSAAPSVPADGRPRGSGRVRRTRGPRGRPHRPCLRGGHGRAPAAMALLPLLVGVTRLGPATVSPHGAGSRSGRRSGPRRPPARDDLGNGRLRRQRVHLRRFGRVDLHDAAPPRARRRR